MANVIFRGPIAREPISRNKPVSGALLPGTWVEDDGTNFVQLTTAVDVRPMILSNVAFKDQDIETAYTDGDTGVAYDVLPGDQVQSAMAAGTYAKGDPLTISAAGRLAAAATGNPIVAFYDGPGATLTAGALADVIVANSSAKS